MLEKVDRPDLSEIVHPKPAVVEDSFQAASDLTRIWSMGFCGGNSVFLCFPATISWLFCHSLAVSIVVDMTSTGERVRSLKTSLFRLVHKAQMIQGAMLFHVIPHGGTVSLTAFQWSGKSIPPL